MRTLAIIVNIFVPGIGTLFIRKYVQGILQFFVWGLGVLFNLTFVGALLGIPLIVIAWIWALITAINYVEVPQAQQQNFSRRLG